MCYLMCLGKIFKDVYLILLLNSFQPEYIVLMTCLSYCLKKAMLSFLFSINIKNERIGNK